MKIFLLPNSFPSDETPMRGVFNLRFVTQMQQLGVDVKVVFFRIWTPKRKLRSSYIYKGVNVTQICLPLFPINNYWIHKLNNRLCSYFGWLLLKNEINTSNLIHSVFLTTNGIIAGKWAKKSKLPHISQAIGSDVNSGLDWFKRKNDFRWVGDIDGIITDSKDLEKTLKASIQNCPKVATIYRGIPVGNATKEANSLSESTTFLYLGGLEANRGLKFGINTKGGITLMEAWKSAEEKLFEVKAKLYFGGPSSDILLFRKWREGLRYPELVELIGKLRPIQVHEFLSKSQVAIIPSMEEGLPNFLMESAAQKKPAIGSDAGGISEFICDKQTGFIFSRGNASQLSDIIVQVASGKYHKAELGMCAYNRVNEHFNAKDYGHQVISFYKSIMEQCAG